MRIIFVGDTAGCGARIAYFANRLTDHTCSTISRSKHDIFGITSFYSGNMYKGPKLQYCLQVIKACMHQDIVVLHDLPMFAPFVRYCCRPKKIICYYHGTRLRRQSSGLKAYERWIDQIIVVTPDLLAYRPKATLMPNLIDTDHFRPIDCPKRRLLVSLCADQDKHLIPSDLIGDLHVRTINPIKYADMPAYLNQYKMIYNPKGHDSVFSGLELQALACGVTVMKPDRIVTDLPDACRPQQYIDRLMSVIENKKRKDG